MKYIQYVKADAGEFNMEWDAFISHASEDKEAVARPLYCALQKRGLKIWLDEFTLEVGDSLRRSIDKGLTHSLFGVVVISPSFLQKEWPQKELDGLVAREVAGVKVILPVWHQITAAEVCRYSPTLADRLAANSSEGIDKVAERLLAAIRKNRPTDAAEITRDGNKIIYCANCGTTPGEASYCPGRASHNFVSSSAQTVYCANCGATPGKASYCPGRASHNFVSSSAQTVYCANCGATPGKASYCPGRASHNFIGS